jgi:hypothetical protein
MAEAEFPHAKFVHAMNQIIEFIKKGSAPQSEETK